MKNSQTYIKYICMKKNWKYSETIIKFKYRYGYYTSLSTLISRIIKFLKVSSLFRYFVSKTKTREGGYSFL